MKLNVSDAEGTLDTALSVILGVSNDEKTWDTAPSVMLCPVGAS